MELFSTEDIQPLPVQEPPQNSDMHQIIEGCCVEASEEQKQNMEKTMLDLEQEVKNVEEQPAERRNHAEKSLQNFRVIHKSSISLKDTSQISSIHEVAPILSTKEHENSLSMGYEHLSITPEMESDEVTKSNAKNLLPIPSECEVTSEDKKEIDELVCDNHSDTFSDPKIDDDISVYDNDFEDIEYVDASVSDPAIVSVEEENVVQREEEEVDLEDISQVQDVALREKLFSITRLISNIESLKDNSTPDRVLNSFEGSHENYQCQPMDHNIDFSEEADLFLFDDSIPPGIENVADDLERDIRFLEELLVDDSILPHESSDSTFEDSPSISRPPPEPPDVESFFDLKPDVIAEEISDKLNEDKCFDPGREINVSTNNEDVDYFPFMFVIRIYLPYLILPEISSLLLSAESEDTIFDPEPPDDNYDLEPEVISAVMEDIDEPDEHFDPGREINVSPKIEDDDYFPFMFVIRFFLPYFIF
nr:hypothetical protein [Tanacetum cinerariifolium]